MHEFVIIVGSFAGLVVVSAVMLGVYDAVAYWWRVRAAAKRERVERYRARSKRIHRDMERARFEHSLKYYGPVDDAWYGPRQR